MRALFTGFLTVGISASLMIGIVFLLRLIFKKAPKALICAMWALVVLRLLLPFQIPVNFSLRPETPVFTETSTAILDVQQTYMPDELPQFVPVQETSSSQQTVVIDYIQIAMVVWSVGVAAMLGYMLFTYLRMKYILRESVKRENGIYENAALPTAFLLGYLRPSIYLPSHISGENAELVIRHERAHLRRGDNWLKLFAYICLAIHWYNPLVWVMYLLLCRDIEGACDEYVIRGLDEQGRSAYSSALLNCGKGKPNFAGCPVAFGEVSIGQRIRNVLNYKKPTLWICIALAVVMIAAAFFFLTDPVKPVPPHYNTLSQLIGQPLSVVADKLGMSQDELIATDNEEYPTFLLPKTVEYMDTAFQIKLHLNYYPEDVLVDMDRAVLHNFEYICEFAPEDAQTAAAAAIRIGNRYLDMYGEPETEATGRNIVKIREATEENLVALYGHKRDKGDYIATQWDLTDGISSEVAEYFYAYRASKSWSTAAFGEYYPEYYLRFSTGYNTMNDKLYLKLAYEVGTVYSVRKIPYEQLPLQNDTQVQDTLNQAEELPYYSKLESGIGKPLDTVCASLGVSREELVPVDYVQDKVASNTRYMLPFTVEYMGAEFQIYLSPNYNAGVLDGTLYTFGYYAKYQPEQRSEAVEAAMDMARQLAAVYGTPNMESFNQLGDLSYSNVTKEKLENLFEQYPGRAGMGLIWDLTDEVSADTDSYLKRFKDTEHWRGIGKADTDPHYYLQMDIGQDQLSNEFRMKIICTVGALDSSSDADPVNNEVFTDAFFADVVEIAYIMDEPVSGEEMMPIIRYLKSLRLTHSDEELPREKAPGTYGGWDIVGMRFTKADGTSLTIQLNQWAMSGLPGGSYYVTDYLEAMERGDKSLLRSLWEACGRAPEQYPFYD